MRNFVLRVCPLVILGLAVGAGPAAAHASLVSSSPVDGASITSSPSAVRLTFSEEVSEPAYAATRAPNGSVVKVTAVLVDANTVTTRLEATDQRGRYTTNYRVISADGHPVEGSIRWTTTTGRIVKQVESDDEGFLWRNRSHFFWGILGAALAIALLLAPLRGRDDKSNA